jgi:uncharacterized Zn-binding protein involved in type VI secretion
MGKPAARLTDIHTCPMVTGMVPHVGGPITGPGCSTVLIGGIPAAIMSDMCVCVGPTASVILGSSGVFFGGKPAARMGDSTAHGGVITTGCANVLIGETSGAGGGGVATVPFQVMLNTANSMYSDAKADVSQALRFQQAANNGTAFIKKCPICGK